jgi:predicted MFS family arabinose efflux permease
MVNVSAGSTARYQAAPPKVVLPVLCLCSFSVIFNLRVLGPVLVDISRDLEVTIAKAGSLAVAYSLPFTIVALFVAPLSDRFGRRLMMLLGISTLSLAAFGAVLAPSFEALFLARILAGFGGAVLQPATMASVGDYFPYAERGHAMSWVIGAATMSTVLGVPAGTFLAGIFTWRWIFALLGIILLVATTIVVIVFPEDKKATRNATKGLDEYKSNFRRVLHQPSAIATLLSTVLFGMLWHGWNTFNGAFFIQTFSLSTKELAPIIILQGSGTFTGSYIGGVLSDRMGKKNTMTIGLTMAGIIMILLTNMVFSLWLTLILMFLMSINAGIRFTSESTLATEQVPDARGTMMAMDASTLQLGSVLGSSAGSIIIGSFNSYYPLGFVFGTFSLLSSAVARLFIKEKTVDATS